jgi:hypothetical protein
LSEQLRDTLRQYRRSKYGRFLGRRLLLKRAPMIRARRTRSSSNFFVGFYIKLCNTRLQVVVIIVIRVIRVVRVQVERVEI